MEIRPLYAILSYALMAMGLSLFVLPNVRSGNISDSVFYGGSFGLIVYGIYDFTAAAVLRDWDVKLAILDVIWGITVYTAAAYAGSLFEEGKAVE